MSHVVSHPFASNLVNLASPKLGAQLVFATDEFFGSKERLIKDADPIFVPDKYDEHGKWMDGWESRRRRDGNHDYCILELKAQGCIEGIDIDTSHFTGNHPPYASIYATQSKRQPDLTSPWEQILRKSSIKPDCHNYFKVESPNCFNYVRLNIFPDGGVARLRIYGRPKGVWTKSYDGELIELSSVLNGGYVVGYNDAHYGNPWIILSPGRGNDMGDGWETRRRRQPGNDWIVVELGKKGVIKRIEIDTAHFKGNFPDRCSIEFANFSGNDKTPLLDNKFPWKTLLDQQKLYMDQIHSYDIFGPQALEPATHLRLSIYPDGGISRFRAFGEPLS